MINSVDIMASTDTEYALLWSLPRLPLTECIGKYDSENTLSFDNELIICVETGLVKLRYQLDPRVLYRKNEYAFRTGHSGSARSGVSFFISFLKKIRTSDTKFSSIVDIGGNDLYLAKELIEFGHDIYVVDPVCEPDHGNKIDGINIIGKMIEDVDLRSECSLPDLIVLRHSLEHFSNPQHVLSQCFQQCDPDCIFLIEIPCFNNLIEALRFDAIFHQHYHYFDLLSLKWLIWNCGGEYMHHAFNFQGSCGGSLIIAFRKSKKTQQKPDGFNVEARIQYIKEKISLFSKQMFVMRKLLDQLPQPVYGYGAGLMMATLGYHLDTNFSKLVFIMDDDPEKEFMEYQNIPVTVRYSGNYAPPENSSYLITSMENIRPIYKNILGLKPRRVLVPLLS